MNPKIDEVMEEEWWLESTKQCIQANIDHPTRESFENIIAHIRTLTKSLYQEVFEQGRKEGVQSAIEAKNPFSGTCYGKNHCEHCAVEEFKSSLTKLL